MAGDAAHAAVDLSNCETEPLRFPGAVQPHGAVLVLAALSVVIEAASESCAELLGLRPATLLGKKLDLVIDPKDAAALWSLPTVDLQPLVQVALNGRDLRARSSLNQAGQLVIDFERAGGDFLPVLGTVYHRREVLTALRRLNDQSLIAQRMAAHVREFTEFDRVMIYRFDDAWNGEVFAEAHAPEVEPYLGIHFPASDIPKQARELLQFSHIRYIPDMAYDASALVSRSDRRAIDLGGSCLRAVSPMCIEYNQNMGVHATLVGSLVVEGRLWGLLSCHHLAGPKSVSPAVRDHIEWLCEEFAAVLESVIVRQRAARELSLGGRRRRLVDDLRGGDLKQLMKRDNGAALLTVVNADGFALLANESIQVIGSTPSLDRIRLLQQRRRERQRDTTFFASSALARDLAVDADGISGALFVSLRNLPDVSMIWFRNEQRYYRIWGGDPKNAHLVDEKGRFSPRKSFAKFAQETRGQSVAWTREELASAAELGSLIEIAALKQSEAFVKSVLNSRPQQTAVLDASGAIVLVNRAWGQKGAGADPVGLDYRSVCAAAVGTPSDADAALAAGGIGSVLKKMAAHYTQEYPCELNGAKRWIRMTVYPVMAPGEGAVVVHSDITLRRKQEDELTQYRQHLEALVDERTAALKVAHAAVEAEQHAAVELLAVENEAKIRSSKLQAVGTLAAGIAHDFNNILASIIGYAEMTADDLPENSTVKRNVAQILSGSLRARDLVARMLAFARAGPAERTAVELASSVEEALALLHSSLPSSIELTFENRLIDRHMSVLGDPTQLVQVVMNLCINSSQAILGRGTISVGLAPAGGYDDAPPSLKGGVCLTVTDSGVGMTPEVQERVFDPFFTTKAPGAGTGLGLSVVYGIVSAMGGDIKVHSSTEKLAAGTQFRVFLPRFVAHPAAAALYCAPTAQP